jgi:rRNA-processing protein FCF1
VKKYALDTNILSYFLKGNEHIADKIEKEKNNRNTFVIPPIVYFEINNWLLRNNSKVKPLFSKRYTR